MLSVLRLFSTLSRRVGAFQISVIVLNVLCFSVFPLVWIISLYSRFPFPSLHIYSDKQKEEETQRQKKVDE